MYSIHESTDPYFSRDCVPFIPSSHKEELLKVLAAEGYPKLPFPTLQPDVAGARRVFFLTGVDIGEFDEFKHHRTPTKAYYAPTGKKHLLNQSGAVLVQLLDQGFDVIAQTRPEQADSLAALMKLHPNGEKCKIISCPTHEFVMIEKLAETLAELSRVFPIKQVDFLVYDSFMPALAPARRTRPFAPLYEESKEDMMRMTSWRIAMCHHLALTSYHLLANCGQQEIRFLLISSLAARRPGGNLYCDALHKVVSSVFLETFVDETIHNGICPKAYGIEIAPGVVDRGPYDKLSTRQATIERAAVNGFPYRNCNDKDISTFPQLNPNHLAEIALAYLLGEPGEDLRSRISPEARELLFAGREFSEINEKLGDGAVISRDANSGTVALQQKALPRYVLDSDMLGGMPSLKPGYVFIPATPKGQYF